MRATSSCLATATLGRYVGPGRRASRRHAGPAQLPLARCGTSPRQLALLPPRLQTTCGALAPDSCFHATGVSCCAMRRLRRWKIGESPWIFARPPGRWNEAREAVAGTRVVPRCAPVRFPVRTALARSHGRARLKEGCGTKRDRAAAASLSVSQTSEPAERGAHIFLAALPSDGFGESMTTDTSVVDAHQIRKRAALPLMSKAARLRRPICRSTTRVIHRSLRRVAGRPPTRRCHPNPVPGNWSHQVGPSVEVLHDERIPFDGRVNV